MSWGTSVGLPDCMLVFGGPASGHGDIGCALEGQDIVAFQLVVVGRKVKATV